jgi:hypothetical protein
MKSHTPRQYKSGHERRRRRRTTTTTTHEIQLLKHPKMPQHEGFNSRSSLLMSKCQEIKNKMPISPAKLSKNKANKPNKAPNPERSSEPKRERERGEKKNTHFRDNNTPFKITPKMRKNKIQNGGGTGGGM